MEGIDGIDKGGRIGDVGEIGTDDKTSPVAFAVAVGSIFSADVAAAVAPAVTDEAGETAAIDSPSTLEPLGTVTDA